MKILDVKSLGISDIKVFKYHRFSDERGYFTEIYRSSDLQKEIPSFENLQSNESYSKKGVIRGLHAQWNPYMGKLVRVLQGRIIDLALDIRSNSATFGKLVGYELITFSTQQAGEWIWLPVGFAHGIVCLEESTIEYFCTGEYNPECEFGISPLAKDIDWTMCDADIREKVQKVLADTPLISEKDKNGIPSIKEWKMDPRSAHFNL